MRLALALPFAVSLWAQSGLDRPQLGMMLDPRSRLRAVLGIPGSTTLGDPEGDGILSFACSRELCLLKTETAIVSSARGVDAPAGSALFALAGETAMVYFPLSRQFVRWHNGVTDPLLFPIDGEVLSLRLRETGSVEFAVRRENATWVVDAQDEILGSIPSRTGPVMLLEDGVIYASSHEIALRRDDGSEMRFPVEGAESFSAMNDGYLQIRTRRESYMICIARGRERIFQLPEL